jgi:hypothetical protein
MDEVQETTFTDYNVPSSEPIRLNLEGFMVRVYVRTE